MHEAARPQLVRRAMFDALVELSPDPVWVVERGGALVAFNPPFERWWREITGTRPLLGQPLEGGGPRLAELQRRALDGRSMMADVRLIAAGIERTYGIHARSTPEAAAFTAREVAVDASANERAAEMALIHLFAADEPFAELLTNTLEFLCASDGWDAAILWRAEGQLLRAEAMWFGSEETREKLEPRVRAITFPRGHGVPGRVWSSGEVVWIPDILDESTMERAELATAAGLHSVVAAPLAESGRVTGVIEFFTVAIRPINERTKQNLTRIATALARVIERRRLVDQIERKGAEWTLTFDSIALPIFLVAADGRIARVNRAARELAGARYTDIVGHSLAEHGDDEPWKTLRDAFTAVLDSGMACTAQVVTPQATWDVSASPVRAASRDDERVIVAMRDTTEIVRLQDSVRRGEHLAALGELVAGVAHEIMNPLFGMAAMLDVLDREIEDRPDAIELTGALRKWIARLRSLTENLLAYGKTWSIDLQPRNVREVLEQAIDASRPRAEDSKIRIDGEVADGVVLMDASRLVLVFENLLMNALQHSPTNGRIAIIARRDDEAVEVTVRDHGPGFDPNDLPRIFEPFFTRRRGGTGLGLSIVQRIVDEHGGTVNASNCPEGGAAVRVRLPIYQPPTSL